MIRTVTGIFIGLLLAFPLPANAFAFKLPQPCQSDEELSELFKPGRSHVTYKNVSISQSQRYVNKLTGSSDWMPLSSNLEDAMITLFANTGYSVRTVISASPNVRAAATCKVEANGAFSCKAMDVDLFSDGEWKWTSQYLTAMGTAGQYDLLRFEGHVSPQCIYMHATNTTGDGKEIKTEIMLYL